MPEEPPAPSRVTGRETRALHHEDGKVMGSLTEGLTKNTNLVLTESLKDLQTFLVALIHILTLSTNNVA